MTEFKEICAMSSNVIYHAAYLVEPIDGCGSSVKAAAVDVCQVKAVNLIFCSVPLASPSVLCHYWDVSINLKEFL